MIDGDFMLELDMGDAQLAQCKCTTSVLGNQTRNKESTIVQPSFLHAILHTTFDIDG